MWGSLEQLKRLAIVVPLCFVAATRVVSSDNRPGSGSGRYRIAWRECRNCDGSVAKVGDLLGMPFEMTRVIAAMFGCTVTRVLVGRFDKVSCWLVRVPVASGGMTFLLATSIHPSLVTALVLGITVATPQAKIIDIAEVRGRKLLGALLPGAIEGLRDGHRDVG